MEYVNDRGLYVDAPMEEFLLAFKETYPRLEQFNRERISCSAEGVGRRVCGSGQGLMKYLEDFQQGQVYRFRAEPLSKEEIVAFAPSKSKPDRGVLAYTLRAMNPAGQVVFTADTPVMIKRQPSEEQLATLGRRAWPRHGRADGRPAHHQVRPDAQKAYWLPRILSCEDIWCQGYSEPGAGSDLANLRRNAVIDGDEFAINGQKIWTTMAHDSTHIFILVRTDPKAPKKQQGISFILVPMDPPGVEVRTITTLAVETEFCEVFFDDASTRAKTWSAN